MYSVDEEKKSPVVEPTDQGQQVEKKEPQQTGVREDEGTVVDGVFTVAPQYSGSQVRDIATRYRAANPNSGDYYMHDGVKYSYADLVQPAQKPVQDAPMREPKGYYQKVNGGVVSGGRFIADDNLTKEEAEQAAIAYGDSVGNDDAYYYQYGGKVRKAKKSLFARPDVKKPEVIDTTGYAELHRVNNGTVVDGLFVADDNLSADAARSMALRYYLGVNPKGKAFYYQHNGKIYVVDTTNRAEAKYTPEGERPAPIKVGAEKPAPQPTQTKPVQNQEAKPVPQANAQQSASTVAQQQDQASGKEKDGFFNRVGGFLGDVKDNVSEFAEGVKDNIQARKVQKSLGEREVQQPQRPAIGGSTKGAIEAQAAQRFKEASQNLTPLKSKEEQELEGINAYLKDDKRDFSHAGGYAVNGYFVADDALDKEAATRYAKQYYADLHKDYKGTSPGPYYDVFQWRGKQIGTKEGDGSKPRWSELPKKVNASDYEEFDKQIARKKELERSLSEKPAPTESAASQPATATNTPAQQTNVQPEIQNDGAQTGSQQTQSQQTGSTVQGSNPEVVTSTEVKADTNGSEVPEEKGTEANVTTVTPPATSTAKPAQTVSVTNTPAGVPPAANASSQTPSAATTNNNGTSDQTNNTSQPQTDETDIYARARKRQEEAEKEQETQITNLYNNEIKSQAELIKAIEEKQRELNKQDAAKVKRENTYRYITGVGDVISGIANLVGTAKGASHQEQEYQAPELVKKAEAARKARKLEIKDLNTRLDEMRKAQRTLASARDLKLSELKAQLQKDLTTIDMQEAAYNKAIEVQSMRGATALEVAEANAAKSAANAALRAQRDSGTGKVKVATFKNAQGQQVSLNVYAVRDFDDELKKAVMSNMNKWTDAEMQQYEDAKAAMQGSVITPSDSGRAMNAFYESMALKPFVYEYFKRIPGVTTATSNTGLNGYR